ncbi:hypothetical protein HMI56_004954 [Coelomomyces lativittatus]|nr:hypothetical protein HMI56_004954 [Coelomomyces lativittatus]
MKTSSDEIYEDSLSYFLNKSLTFDSKDPPSIPLSSDLASPSLTILYDDFPLDPIFEEHVETYETKLLESKKEIDALRLENKKLKKALVAQKVQIQELKECNQVLSTNLSSLFQTATLEITRLKEKKHPN